MTPASRFRLLQGTFLFLSALWCGVMAAFSLGAGTVLRLSPSKAAGGVVNRALLDSVDILSVAIGVLLLVSVFGFSTASRRERGLMLRLALVAVAAALISRFVVTPRLWALREQMPLSMDLVPAESPLRKAWGQLHAISTLALLLRILCAAGLFYLAFALRLPASAAPLLFERRESESS